MHRYSPTGRVADWRGHLVVQSPTLVTGLSEATRGLRTIGWGTALRCRRIPPNPHNPAPASRGIPAASRDELPEHRRGRLTSIDPAVLRALDARAEGRHGRGTAVHVRVEERGGVGRGPSPLSQIKNSNHHVPPHRPKQFSPDHNTRHHHLSMTEGGRRLCRLHRWQGSQGAE